MIYLIIIYPLILLSVATRAPRQITADDWYNKGIEFFIMKKCNEALQAFDKAIELSSQYINAWINKGFILNNLGKYEEAIAAFDTVISLNPKSIDAWYNKGFVLDSICKYDKAIEAYDKAIELDPQCIGAWNNKGIALSKLGRYYEAIVAFDRAIELNPQYVNAWNNKANAFSAQFNYEESVKAYDKAIEIDPNCAKAWYNKGCDSLLNSNTAKPMTPMTGPLRSIQVMLWPGITRALLSWALANILMLRLHSRRQRGWDIMTNWLIRSTLHLFKSSIGSELSCDFDEMLSQ